MMNRGAWLLLSGTTRYAGQAGLLLLLLVYLGAESAGVYALSLAISAPIFVLFGLGMRTVYLTLEPPYSVAVWLRARTWSALLAVCFTVVAVAFVAEDVRLATLLVAAIKTAELYLDLMYAMLQKAGRFALIEVSALSHAIATVLPAWLALVGGGGLERTLLFVVVVRGALLGLFSILLLRAYGRVRTGKGQFDEVSRGAFKRIASAGLATGAAHGLLTLTSSIPQYVLSSAVSNEAVAVFAVVMYVGVACEIVLNALSQAWIPTARLLHADGQLGPRKSVQLGMSWSLKGAVIGAVGVTAAWAAFPLVFGAAFYIDFSIAVPLWVYIAIGPAVYVSSTVLAVQNAYRRLLVAATVTVLGCSMLAFFLIPLGGVPGAVWTAALSLGIRWILTALQSTRSRGG